MSTSFTTLDLCLIAAGLFLLHRLFKRAPIAPLPPGPKPLPIIGNVTDMPTENEWLTFAEWGRKWGGIVSVTLLGQPLIIVNSAKIMEDLDKKGSIYSDRPKLIMGGELVGYVKTLVLMPYGERLRIFRRHVARLIGSADAIHQFLPLQEHETRRFLRRVLANPSNLSANLRKTSGAIIMRITYGIEVQEHDDPFVSLIEHANDNFSIATKAGQFLVDVFPSLRLIPEWFPGAGFKRKAREWRKDMEAMVEVPYAETKNQMLAGTAPPSFVSTLLEHEDKLTAQEVSDIKYTASSLYGAGADTTVSAQYAFFLAMLLNPDVQKKAQAELDAVVGTDRLPNSSDRPHLPYLGAVLTEILRWNSVAPTGVPHCAMEDGIVNGYLIPKKSIIIANLWGMLHDPENYSEPFKFDPSRHIATPEKPAQLDPRHACFGYGRRVCAGMQLAESSLFLTIAMSLAVFDIARVDGEELPVHENTSGIISHPKPFHCLITPRSEKAISLIHAEED